ncbi:MAG: hypothetical protein HQL48_06955 [Gammaproteobacteria bacterium]|nr:hypothetical protein [Gammaproteobacteria bacterium]
MNRPSTLYLLITAILITLIVASWFDAAWRREQRQPELEQMRQLVRQLELTDLALVTEARYIRHLSQTDLFAPFQDHPLALEHFPSGSLIQPPQR